MKKENFEYFLLSMAHAESMSQILVEGHANPTRPVQCYNLF